MDSTNAYILTINGGSSSIKFSLYLSEPLKRMLSGKVDRIGVNGTTFTFSDATQHQRATSEILAADHRSAANFLIEWLEKRLDWASIKAVGHRIVHGLDHSQPERVTPELLAELKRLRPYIPDHLPAEIELIEAFRRCAPQLSQVACFDTAFHCTMPRVARLFPLPRRFDERGLRRYGFHGLSYTYLMDELVRVAGSQAARGRVILAHLGNGASLAAVHEGKSVDTSMGFTPTAGLPMGTRPGDLDAGVAWYLLQSENMSPTQFNHMINHESGLLGISETSSDMRDLLDRQASDIRAAEAVELFCYQARKWIGAFAAVLGGLETLVFAGGIGENAGEVRARICHGLEFLGVALDESQNAIHAPLISAAATRVAVRIIRTDEEQVIASAVDRLLRIDDSSQRATGKKE